MKNKSFFRHFLPQIFPDSLGENTRYTRALIKEIKPWRVDRATMKFEDFEEVYKQNEITEEELRRRMDELIVSKRVCWLGAIACLIWTAMAVVSTFQYGFENLDGPGMLRLVILMNGPPAAGLCCTLMWKYTFRLWQCEIRQLAGIQEFFQAGGLGRMIKF